MSKVINLSNKFNLFQEPWHPKIVGELNDSYVKLVKLEGEFVWHHHDNEDELFMVIKGTLVIKLRDQELTISRRRIRSHSQRRGTFAGGGERSPGFIAGAEVHR